MSTTSSELSNQNITILADLIDDEIDEKKLHFIDNTDSGVGSATSPKQFTFHDYTDNEEKRLHEDDASSSSTTSPKVYKTFEEHLKELAAHEMEVDDDDNWHELQMSRRRILKQKINEYANTFTMHGLSKMVTGKNIESMFWFMMLFGGLVTCFVVIHGLITKFLRYDVYTEIRAVIADDNYFPAVAFCENTLFVDSYFAYCGQPVRRKDDSRAHQYCHQRTAYDRKGNITGRKDIFWSNGMFNVIRCKTLGGKSCLDNRYLRSMMHYNHTCFEWNYSGNFSDIYSHVELLFDFNAPHWLEDTEEEMLALPHYHEEHEIDITKKVIVEPGKSIEIKLDKTIIKRLPSPYPSNCSNEKGEDIFEGRYTRRSCIESHSLLEMYKECGDTFDYILPLIPADFKKKYGKNLTIGEAEKCVRKYSQQVTEKTSDCGFSCDDYDLSVMHSFSSRKSSNYRSRYHVIIQFQKVDTYQTIEEKELYSWDQMLSEMGGLIGLIIGASVISVVEVIVYLFLVLIKQCCC